MTDTTRRPDHRTNPRDAASRRTRTSPARRRHAESISDAVIAAYIHDLRHSAIPAGTPGRRGG